MKLKNGFLQALLNEINLQSHFLKNEVVETIYFGGGTPSLLSGDEIYGILNAINMNFSVTDDVEITLEANPDDITMERLTAWEQTRINRLSIGVQSFFEVDLKWMNRAHNAAQAEDSIKMAQQAGFSNITIDLIFGTPTLTDTNWRYNIEKAISFGIPHLSCYSLTVEPRTALDLMIRKKSVAPVSSDDQARQFLLLMAWLTEAGYEQYEISNYALPGRRSRHNSSYWQGKKYLGLGPSAHSFNGQIRQWNISNNALYIESLRRDTIPFELETLTDTQKLNEWVMTSLRTKEGLQLYSGSQHLNDKIIAILKKKSNKYLQQNLLTEDGDAIILTSQGKLYADGIAAALFFEEAEIKDCVYAAGF